MGNGRISQMRVGFQVGPPTRVFDAEVGQDGHGFHLLTRKIVNKCSGFNELLNYQTGA